MNCLAVRLLENAEVDGIAAELGQRTFSDGKLTAHGLAREVKNNLQLTSKGPETDELQNIVISAFRRNAEVQAFALPRRVAAPIFSLYDPGMEYGAHVDNALIGGIRTDMSVTLFLSRPESYEGGELVIDLPLGSQETKLDAGEAIVYPSNTLHHVAPVIRGTRLAAVTWIQSTVRDERIRAILYDLHKTSVDPAVANNPSLSLLLGKSYLNLLRYAAEA